MRNLRKFTAVVIALALVLTSMIPAFAASTVTFDYEVQATAIKDLGIWKGDLTGDLMLEKGLTRAEGAVLVLKTVLAKTEADQVAADPASLSTFADVTEIPAWADGWMALAVKEGVVKGTTANKLNANGPLLGKDLASMFMNALGFADVNNYSTSVELLAAKSTGTILVAIAKDIQDAELTRDAAAAVVFDTLTTTAKDDTKTVVANYVGTSATLKAVAVAAGLIVLPTVLAVESVTATNLVRVVVNFNKAIDEDTIDNGDFAVNGTDVTAADVSLSTDDKVATLTVPTMSNGDEISIVISGISDLAAKEIADYESNFTPMDVQQPTVLSLEFTGPETVKVTFSEPIQEFVGTPEIIIDGGIYSASPVSGYDDSDEVTVNLGTELDKGIHTFKIKGFLDFAEYSNLITTISKTYEAIVTAPAVTVKEATQSYVILKFDRPVTDIEIGDFYQTYASWAPLEVQNEDGTALLSDSDWTDTVRLAFTDAECVTPTGIVDDDMPLPVGTAKVVVKDEAVEDHWGNLIDGDVAINTQITSDITKPEISKISVETERQIFVYFSEDVVEADAETEANYVIKGSDGVVVSSSKWRIVYNATDKYVDILFNEDLDNGNYSITAEAIADTSVSANTLATVTKLFTITDITAVITGTVAAWVDGEHILYVKYADTMDSSSVLDKANYRLGTAELADSVKLTMFSSKIVKMQFASDTVDLVAQDLVIGRVKDAAGNIVAALSTSVEITPEIAPKITAIKKIAENKFELTVDQDLKSIASASITVDFDGATTSGAAIANASYKFVNDGTDTKITVTVPTAHISEGTEAVTSLYEISIVANGIKSVTGVAIAPVTFIAGDAGNTAKGLIDDVNFTDGVAPEVATLNDDAVIYAYDKTASDADTLIDHIIIKYTEDINPGTVSKYTYVVDGYDVSSVTVIDATDMDDARASIEAGSLTSLVGKYVVLTIAELDDGTVLDTDSTPGVTQKYSIEDVAGNVLVAQDGVDAISAAAAAALNP